MRILIANRGEIARRIIRTAHRLGHETVAVFAEPDAASPFVSEATMAVLIGPADLAQSYLAIDRILAAASQTESTAVHPGYGFLSENTDFARAVVAAGLTWIGPKPDVVESMGSKIEARRIASGAGVPIIPGFDESQDRADMAAAAERIGFPVLVKAAAGGGGKGIRIVHEASEFDHALTEAISEAERSFGDGRMIVERYIQRPRHVEVQVIGDRHGNLIELGTRECSVQRRYQKVLEEAPAPNLPDQTRQGLRTSASELARSIGYDSAGTVEFVVDDESGDYFFLEMNTRLQVEHPVTEAVTGLDLVELMIRSAAGEPLSLAQSDVTFEGHAMEARINAEDPAAGFAPQIGTVTHLRVPNDVRWESAVELGNDISPFYDAMIAKLIVAGPDRAATVRKLAVALDRVILGGVMTNLGFHRWLIDQPQIVDGTVTTRFLDEADLPATPEPATALAGAAWSACLNEQRAGHAWARPGNIRLVPHERARTVFLRDREGTVHDVDLNASPDARWLGREIEISESGVLRRFSVSVDLDAGSVAVNVAGHSQTFEVVDRTEHWAPEATSGHGHAGAIVSPFPAVVTETPVQPGDHVNGGDVVVVIEAMKMLHSLKAAGPGIVAEVRVAPGDQTQTNQTLVTFEEPEPSDADPDAPENNQ